MKSDEHTRDASLATVREFVTNLAKSLPNGLSLSRSERFETAFLPDRHHSSYVYDCPRDWKRC